MNQTAPFLVCPQSNKSGQKFDPFIYVMLPNGHLLQYKAINLTQNMAKDKATQKDEKILKSDEASKDKILS